jgi:hypothetical protein
MSNRVCFGIFLISFLGAIVEGLLLQKNLNSLIILAATGTVMVLDIFAMEVLNRYSQAIEFSVITQSPIAARY